MRTTAPASLPFTGDAEADALLASDPMALLIGFVLDQQFSVQKAFGGPLELQRRVGTLDPATIAAMDPPTSRRHFVNGRRCTGARATWPSGRRHSARPWPKAAASKREASVRRRGVETASHPRGFPATDEGSRFGA